MQYDRTIIGYHGCDETVAEQLLSGAWSLKASTNEYDWLGHGIYFWEWGLDRAWRFAQEQQHRGKVNRPAVVGALVQLGRCFDLMDTRFTNDLANFFPMWRQGLEASGHKLPVNKGGPQLKGRYLDCAVFNAYLQWAGRLAAPYDTVRCAFAEGEPIFEGAGVRMESHIQVAVRNPAAVVGVFRPVRRT